MREISNFALKRISKTSFDYAENIPVFIFIAIFALSFQPLKGAGLLFSRETPQTYLDLFSGNDISFTNSVTISFDLSIHSHESFGQIWVYEDKAAPYSFAYIGRDKSSSSFVINSLSDKKQFLEIPVSPQAIGARKWLHVETRLDFQHQKAEVTIDGQKYSLDGITIPNPSKANIIFGANIKAIPEVPVMVIKNIMVRDEASHSFLFPLTESDGKLVHEAGNKLHGTVVNPTWQINKQFFWQEIGTFTSSAAAGIAFDEPDRQILVVGDNNISKFDINTLKLTEYLKETVGTQTGYSGEAIYNPDKQETYFYNLADIGGQTGPFFSTISDKDLPTRIVSPQFSNPLHHHAYFFDQASQSLYIFGGYGNYQYSNLTYQYDFDHGAWKEIQFTGDVIYPRMHTVAGKGPVEGSFLYSEEWATRRANRSLARISSVTCICLILPSISSKSCGAERFPTITLFRPADLCSTVKGVYLSFVHRPENNECLFAPV